MADDRAQMPARRDTKSGAPIIEIHQLNKAFAVNGRNIVTIFEDLSLRISRGSFVSFIGPSGCGKSTLLRLIAGLITPTRGRIVFNGKVVSGPAKGMIYVFQQYAKSIFPWRTVIENIEFGLFSNRRMAKRQAREKCREYLRLVGLEKYENYYPFQLSGGMQQRVAIARALICEPQVLLMDEPFSAVDAMTRAVLQELLLSIWETIPVTILFVTHDVEEAVFLSGRIVALGSAPATIRQDMPVDLPYPRDQIRTRGDERFTAIRQQLFANIFMQEKQIQAAAE